MLVLEQDFGVLVFGFDVPLGIGRTRFPPSLVSMQPDPARPAMSRVRLAPPRTDGRVVFALDPPPGRLPSNRTLAAGEEPTDAPAEEWDADWFEKEREADVDLRGGHGIRFTNEDAFLAWLEQPDRDPAA